MGRKLLPGVREGLESLAEVRRVVVITGRSWFARDQIRRWLALHGLDQYIDDVIVNNTDLATAHYKLWTAHRLEISEHIDDDGSIAFFLANHGVTVYLRRWPRNRDLPYPTQVRPFTQLTEVAAAIRESSA
jgi:hypothetical protein